jgi:hypothetical protein
MRPEQRNEDGLMKAGRADRLTHVIRAIIVALPGASQAQTLGAAPSPLEARAEREAFLSKARIVKDEGLRSDATPSSAASERELRLDFLLAVSNSFSHREGDAAQMGQAPYKQGCQKAQRFPLLCVLPVTGTRGVGLSIRRSRMGEAGSSKGCWDGLQVRRWKRSTRHSSSLLAWTRRPRCRLRPLVRRLTAYPLMSCLIGSWEAGPTSLPGGVRKTALVRPIDVR